MPNNSKKLIAEIHRRVKAHSRDPANIGVVADMQKRIATLYLTNLLRLTNVDTGRLAGGWTVRLRKAAGNKRASRNRSKLPNKKQFAPIDKITGKGTVSIVNSIPYAGYVDRGTVHQRASNFTRRAALMTKAQLKRSGINLKPRGIA